MPSSSRLGKYRSMRDFAKTREPRGSKGRASKAPRFVVQEHDATAHHYDFRLEDEGVLKSWAVPKGPSLDPDVKRLAVPTEDHPLDYRTFEGIIPEAQYGAGPVIVWDEGTYVNLSELDGRLISMAAALKKGHAKFWLQGKKLQGGYHLVRAGFTGRRPTWLLMKMRDAGADPARDIVGELPESVRSRRTIQDVLAGRRTARRASPGRRRASRPRRLRKSN